MPSRPSASSLSLGKEKFNAKSSSRPEASGANFPWRQSREGARESSVATSRSSGSWASGASSSFALRKNHTELYPGLSEVGVAYPGAMVYQQEEGFWLRLESLLLPNVGRKALFVVSVMPGTGQVTAWGYWHMATIGVSWIGPRHTNYPDGSICAFDTTDGTWQYGDDLVKLIDLYTVWAIRHLHLEWLGKWPGPQASANPVERITEFKDNEWCGCSAPQGTYGNCCKQHDLAEISPKAVLSFLLFSQRCHRYPPFNITAFASSAFNPPKLELRLVSH